MEILRSVNHFFLHPERISSSMVRKFSSAAIVALSILSAGLYLIPFTLANRKVVKKEEEKPVQDIAKKILEDNKPAEDIKTSVLAPLPAKVKPQAVEPRITQSSQFKTPEPKPESVISKLSNENLLKLLALGDAFYIPTTDKRRITCENIKERNQETFDFLFKLGNKESGGAVINFGVSRLQDFPNNSPCYTSKIGLFMALNYLLLTGQIYAWEEHRVGVYIYLSKDVPRIPVDPNPIGLVTKEKAVRLSGVEVT